MRKTSVYLPDALKRRLAAAAEAGHRSEADLIREAIEQRVAAATAPAGAGTGALSAGARTDPVVGTAHRRC